MDSAPVSSIRVVAVGLSFALASVTAACALLTDFGNLSGGEQPIDASSMSSSEGGASQDANAVATEALVAHWTFDEASGSMARDAIGAAHADLVGAPRWTTGKIGGALNLDGVDDYAAVAAIPALGTSYTLSLWVRLATSAAAEQRFVDVPNATLTLRVKEGRFSFHWNDTPSTTDSVTDPDIAQFEVWHHVAATHDGTTAKLYVNGVMRAAKVQATKSFGSTPFRIGAKAVRTNFTAGDIDDVRLYERALSADEIAKLQL